MIMVVSVAEMFSILHCLLIAGSLAWPSPVLWPVSRVAKVLNFFPVPVSDECLASDGRRTGVCLNAYECRIQNGNPMGQCALGFGVCCVCE